MARASRRWAGGTLGVALVLLVNKGLTSLKQRTLSPPWIARSGQQLEGLRRAHREGLFDCQDRCLSGQELGEEELLWSREYGPGGAYEFWSLGQPKVEIENLCHELQLEELQGFSAVILGCGLGLDVAHLARRATGASDTLAVCGVDFAWAAIKAARSNHKDT
eukprot:symbB.v1.2.040415.t1/scaffold7215.1/size12605/1